jgi:translation initiation factor 1
MNQRLVYDSDAPLAKPPRPSRAKSAPSGPSVNVPRDGVVRLLRDRKGRGGKTVTLVAGVNAPPAELSALASDLKRLCGTGGTLRGDVIEIQGDVRDRIKPELERRGYTVRIAGG